MHSCSYFIAFNEYIIHMNKCNYTLLHYIIHTTVKLNVDAISCKTSIQDIYWGCRSRINSFFRRLQNIKWTTKGQRSMFEIPGGHILCWTQHLLYVNLIFLTEMTLWTWGKVTFGAARVLVNCHRQWHRQGEQKCGSDSRREARTFTSCLFPWLGFVGFYCVVPWLKAFLCLQRPPSAHSE